MAKSRFEYVKTFEQDDSLLPGTWIVVRLDGRGFHRFTTEHEFTKPVDERGLQLMNACAEEVMKQHGDIIIAYGQSDEYSFVLQRDSTLFKRRASKLQTTIVSLFSSCFVFFWPRFFPEQPLAYPPAFDGRTVCYPTTRSLRDYLSWRAADTHINNLYNTAFWALVKLGGRSGEEAEAELSGSVSEDKQELLFTTFGINYAHLPAMYRRGSCWVRETYLLSDEQLERTLAHKAAAMREESKDAAAAADDAAATAAVALDDKAAAKRLKRLRKKLEKARKKRRVAMYTDDIIGDAFWDARPDVLGTGE